MGEALLTGRTGSIKSGESGQIITTIIKSDDIFVVPNAKNQSFSVRIFGGGGCGDGNGISAGGGGGYMNNGILILNEGEIVPITIGKGALLNNSTNRHEEYGGTTSFGTYLSAEGGQSGTNTGGRNERAYGGNGGSGGGSHHYAGDGYQFGGGGSYYYHAGNGGKWGGGGGSSDSWAGNGGCLYENSQNKYQITGYSGLAGNGSSDTNNGGDGTNTIGLNSVDPQCRGYGKGGAASAGGGGGYGGNGGKYGGGGGGYGADGGDSRGGGGGYGNYGKGGNNYGGGGAYGPGGSTDYGNDGKYGGGGSPYGNGGDGICIIQYYI